MILKYATQLLILFLLVSLVSVIVISAILYVSQINSQREQLSTILESISQIGSDNISKWLDERKTNVQNLVESKVFIASVKDMGNPELSSQEIFQSRLKLEEFSTLVHHSWYWLEGLKISDPNSGEMIFEFRDSPTENLREQQHFIDALNGNVAFSEVYSSKEPIINEFGEYEKDVPTLLISAPIYSDVGLEGILTARVNVFKIDIGVIKYVTNFHSGDAFMVNSNGFLLSRSAFPQDIVNFVERRPELELRVFDPENQELTKLFQNAEKNKPITIVDGYNDYRGITVIGSINPIQDTDWFFIFEIDEAEAYQEFSVLQIIVGYSLSILAIVVFVTSSHFAKTFARPIIHLKESAEKITSGNLDSPIKTKGSYEISKLSESMEQMRQSVKKSIETEKDLAVAQNKIDVDKKLAKEKDEFSSMITHELKSPIFPIIGYCKMLKKDGMIGNLNEEQLKAVETIERNATGLEKLILDILDAKKLEMKKLKFEIEEFPLDEFITDLDSSNKNITEQKGIEFVIDSSNIQGLIIKSDKIRLRQVFDNLINNSAKFVNEQGGKIEVGAKKEDHQILFYVRDNGIGISKDKQKDLFKKFYQVDTSLERRPGSSGLGLTICKAITEKLGGKIWVESQEGKGSTFYFTISSNIVITR